MTKIMSKTFVLSLLISTTSFAADFNKNIVTPPPSYTQSITHPSAPPPPPSYNQSFMDSSYPLPPPYVQPISNVPVVVAVPYNPGVSSSGNGRILEIVGNAVGFNDKVLSSDAVQHVQSLITQERYTEEDITTIAAYMDRYNMPAGILRLIESSTPYERHVLLDDSGSMDFSNSTWYDSTDSFQKKTTKRFDELKNRIKQFTVGFAYLPPIERLKITFLNRRTELNFCRGECPPDDFIRYMHNEIDNAFMASAFGGTPIYDKLSAIYDSTEPKLVYLFCDGEPDSVHDRGTGRATNGSDAVKNLIKTRNFERFPTTLVSISDDDTTIQWMKDVDGEAPYVSELDDMVTELSEIIGAHGIGIIHMFAQGDEDFIPSTMSPPERVNFAKDVVSKLARGKKLDEIIDRETLVGILARYEPIWILAHHFSAIDPKGLDALDEKGEMLTAETFNGLIGADFVSLEENVSNLNKYRLYQEYHPITLGLQRAKGANEIRKAASNPAELKAAQPVVENTAKKSRYAQALNAGT